MSFWSTSDNSKLTGEPDATFAKAVTVIPGGTQAPAMIKGFEIKSFSDSPEFYQVTYLLLAGDFKGMEVWHKIHCSDLNPKKADRAKQMLMRLYKLCDLKPMHANAPSVEDLQPMQGKVIAIKIEEYKLPKADGGVAHGNWVSEIWAEGGLPTLSGTPVEVAVSAPPPPVSALNRHSQGQLAVDGLDNDIPF